LDAFLTNDSSYTVGVNSYLNEEIA
jgi:hypothetical protein